jgi:hypothetical protein
MIPCLTELSILGTTWLSFLFVQLQPIFYFLFSNYNRIIIIVFIIIFFFCLKVYLKKDIKVKRHGNMNETL